MSEFDPDEMLKAFLDEKTRRILASVAEESLTVKEISEKCGLPRSTVYRKVTRLAKKGLLEENIRQNSYGHHSKEFTFRHDRLSETIEINGIKVEISYEIQGRTD